MARRHRTLGQRVAQLDRLRLGVALAQQFGLEQVEDAKLLVCRERCVIGNVVGGADEIVEGKNQRAMTRMNDPRRDRKILVTVGLAGSQVTRGGHQLLTTFIGLARAIESPRTRERVPHIGEYAAKTNA